MINGKTNAKVESSVHSRDIHTATCIASLVLSLIVSARL